MYKKYLQLVLTLLLVISFSAKASFFSWLAGDDDNDRTSTAQIKNNSRHSQILDVAKEAEILAEKTPNLNPRVLKLALEAYQNANVMGYPVRKNIITVIDYSLPDKDKRLWVLDLHRQKVLYNTYVAHGQGSGGEKAEYFSNSNGSHQSSIGVFLTQNTYYGSKGYALKLNGLDKGFNDNAARRDIVMHGAWYVNPKFAEQYGHIGRSWGCPSVPIEMVRPIINTIKDGSLIFAYAPKFSWLHGSRFLKNNYF